jgi:hypothetical protein
MLRYESQLRDSTCTSVQLLSSSSLAGAYAEKKMPQQARNNKIIVRTVSTMSRFESRYGFHLTYVVAGWEF